MPYEIEYTKLNESTAATNEIWLKIDYLNGKMILTIFQYFFFLIYDM